MSQKTSETLGKTAQKDLAMQKSTYVSLLGLDGAKKALTQTLADIDKQLTTLRRK